ncbi:molybdopterin-dependent oxidoreductase [Geobacter pickeringii]|uniref:4Fe-4S Mo/W bis-MGD-type domain-containing protein n=1 Tax=Geobacter pickeringii TaxID=345632 RepID=A0A0B5B823_9BACT|nr:molybdopterin-dependent oxidoreductase [Geobacter pickeringii]AJE02763.1 hypothetical protein GPICK_04710 [Geobacter pickeringii]
MKEWTRREFLKAGIVATGTLAASELLAFDVLNPVADPYGAYPYRGWEPTYRNQWKFDYFGRSAHSVNCTGSCTWRAFVKNGIIFKEEQFADYPEINPKIPVHNPRGCQKGANHKEYVYGAMRTKYPLIRADYPGNNQNRGKGNWRRATWDEALGLIANKIRDTIQSSGPDTVNFYAAIPAKHFITVAGGFRLANLIGATAMSFYDWYCDLPPGSPQTWGVQTDSCESADWFNSKYLILWGANLLETRIPDAHFFTEARMNGTKVVAIFPDYNPVSIHADIHVPVKPGTDALLAMGMVKIIIDNGLHDVPYIKQYTDMPFLVRNDTNRFLRESDMVDGGSDAKFYLWDTVTGKAVLAPGTMGMGPPVDGALTLGAINPALEGTYPVGTLTGNITVSTVFSRLKLKLMAPQYGLASVAAETGLDANLIRQIAIDFATTKPARIIEGAGVNHWFHNDLNNRTEILMLALTGNVGKPGSGWDHYVGQEKIWPEASFFKLAFPLGRPRQRFQNTTLWTYVHADVVSDVDHLYPRTINQYIKESVDNGWMPLWPKGTLDNGRQPKVLFIWGANYINQSKGWNDLTKNLLPKLDLIVDLNFRMDTSALHADVVLPAASMFEKWDLNSTDLHSYIIPFTPVINPLHQSRTDWQIWRSLAAALQATGFSFNDTTAPFSPANPQLRNFSTLLNDFDTMNTHNTNPNIPGDPGPFSLANDKDAAQFMLNQAEETSGMTMDQLVAQPRRFPKTSEAWTSDLKAGEAYHNFQRLVERKRPLGTLVGRQQFYIDHPTYLGVREELPVYKPPVDAPTQGQYPLRWITPHGRWSIHSTWRDAKFQLRMQRGRTVVYLNPKEAANRGLQDNDEVVIFNNHGSEIARLDISSRIPVGMALMYHGWEKFMNTTGWQEVTNVRINPTQLAGGYGQLTFRLNYWGPTGSQKDTRVEIKKKV